MLLKHFHHIGLGFPKVRGDNRECVTRDMGKERIEMCDSPRVRRSAGAAKHKVVSLRKVQRRDPILENEDFLLANIGRQGKGDRCIEKETRTLSLLRCALVD